MFSSVWVYIDMYIYPPQEGPKKIIKGLKLPGPPPEQLYTCTCIYMVKEFLNPPFPVLKAGHPVYARAMLASSMWFKIIFFTFDTKLDRNFIHLYILNYFYK